MRPKHRSSAEGAERDQALALLEMRRARLIEAASTIAWQLAEAQGQVTAPEVWSRLWADSEHDAALRVLLEESDPRWMGAVFRNNKTWTRVGWRAEGSHKRPVSVWQRCSEE